MLLAVSAGLLHPRGAPDPPHQAAVVERGLARLSSLFDAMYAERGRASRSRREHLLKASLRIALYSIRQRAPVLRAAALRSCRGSSGSSTSTSATSRSTPPASPRTATACSSTGDVSRAPSSRKVVAEARRRRLLSADHFTVDGFRCWRPGPRSRATARAREQNPPVAGGRNREVDFRGQRRPRETHASSTDPQAQLYTKAGRGRRRSSATWASCSPRTATAWCWTSS